MTKPGLDLFYEKMYSIADKNGYEAAQEFQNKINFNIHLTFNEINHIGFCNIFQKYTERY